MKRLDKPGVAIASLTVGLSAISYVLALALLGSGTTSNSDQNQETALPAGSMQEVAVNGTCRRVVGQGYPLLVGAGDGQEIRFVNAGQRVALVGSSTVRSSNGNLYIQVSVPYGDTNPDVGFMLAQTQLDGDGEPESTLAFCRASDDSSSDDYGSTPRERDRFPSDRTTTRDDSWQEGYPGENDFSSVQNQNSSPNGGSTEDFSTENDSGISAYW